jgi:hypothetical protein
LASIASPENDARSSRSGVAAAARDGQARAAFAADLLAGRGLVPAFLAPAHGTFRLGWSAVLVTTGFAWLVTLVI